LLRTNQGWTSIGPEAIAQLATEWVQLVLFGLGKFIIQISAGAVLATIPVMRQ
jgi:hypothetical protein